MQSCQYWHAGDELPGASWCTGTVRATMHSEIELRTAPLQQRLQQQSRTYRQTRADTGAYSKIYMHMQTNAYRHLLICTTTIIVCLSVFT